MATNTTDYANTFKPAKVFGLPSTAEMLNRVFLKENKETYDEQGNQLFYSNLGHLGNTGNPDAMSVFTLQIANPNITPHIRKVVVKGKEDYQNNSYLIEPRLGSPGIAIIMMKEINVLKQIYCNVRILPFLRVKDIIVDTNSELLTVNIPLNNVVKLNVTLTPSNAGEPLYQTHKTEVTLENTTEAQVVTLKNNLEFSGANLVANFASLVMSITPSPETNTEIQSNVAFDLNLDPATKRKILGLALIFSISAAIVETVTTGSGIVTGLSLGATLLGAILEFDNIQQEERQQQQAQDERDAAEALMLLATQPPNRN